MTLFERIKNLFFWCRVKLSVDKETGERVAIKIMKKSCMSEPSGFECFMNEVNLLS